MANSISHLDEIKKKGLISPGVNLEKPSLLKMEQKYLALTFSLQQVDDINFRFELEGVLATYVQRFTEKAPPASFQIYLATNYPSKNLNFVIGPDENIVKTEYQKIFGRDPQSVSPLGPLSEEIEQEKLSQVLEYEDFIKNPLNIKMMNEFIKMMNEFKQLSQEKSDKPVNTEDDHKSNIR